MADSFYRIVISELRRLKYTKKKGGGKGSHERWKPPDGADTPTATVPYDLKSRHTANSILKEAGSSKRV